MAQTMIGRKAAIQALQVALIILGFVILGAWLATVGNPLIVWTFRIAAPMGALAVAVCLYRMMKHAERLPDHLGKIAKKYFEKDGLCFQPVIEVNSSGTFLSIYFQNRNSGHATATISVNPTNGIFARHKLAPLTATVECPGSAFGVMRTGYVIPQAMAGKRVTFAIAADTKYVAGRGVLVRLRTGVPVGSLRESRASHRLMRSLLLLPLGVVSASNSAYTTIQLPKELPASAGMDVGTQCEILWMPADEPTGGFPVIPRRAAA